MRDTWLILEPEEDYWQSKMSVDDYAQFSACFFDDGTPWTGKAIKLYQNPTQVSETMKKPVFESETINGVNIRMTPCTHPGRPLPAVRKMSLKIEHLRPQDFLALKYLHIYDLKFIIPTNNWGLFGPGRLLTCVFDDINVDWVAVKFGKQVYNISATIRLLDSMEGLQ